MGIKMKKNVVVHVCKIFIRSLNTRWVCSTSLAWVLDVDECVESKRPCPDPDTFCVNTVGTYECQKKKKTLSSPEHSDFQTTGTIPTSTTPPQATTVCPTGYKLVNSVCQDIDECLEHVHTCNSSEKCVNQVASFSCEKLNEIPTDNNNNSKVMEKHEGVKRMIEGDDGENTLTCPSGFEANKLQGKCVGK